MINEQLEVFNFNKAPNKKIVWWKNPIAFFTEKLENRWKNKFDGYIEKFKINELNILSNHEMKLMSIHFSDKYTIGFNLSWGGACAILMALQHMGILKFSFICYTVIWVIFLYKKCSINEQKAMKNFKNIFPYKKELFHVKCRDNYFTLNEDLIKEFVNNKIVFKIEREKIIFLEQDIFVEKMSDKLIEFLEKHSIAYDVSKKVFFVTENYYKNRFESQNDERIFMKK